MSSQNEPVRPRTGDPPREVGKTGGEPAHKRTVERGPDQRPHSLGFRVVHDGARMRSQLVGKKK